MSWSELTEDLLMEIAERLESRSDVVHFRSVCKAWRSSAPLALLRSKNIISPLFPYKIARASTKEWLNAWESSEQPASIVASSVFLLRSTLNPNLRPWLLEAVEASPGKLSVSNSVMDPNTKRTLDLTHVQAFELARLYTLRFVVACFGDFLAPCYSYKAVLFTDPNKRTNNNIGDCTAMVLSNRRNLSALRLRDELLHRRITAATPEEGADFDDIVNFKGVIYAISRQGRTYTIDYHSLLVSKLSVQDPPPHLTSPNYYSHKHLVVSYEGDQLYLIYGLSHWKSSFEAYKLNQGQKRWDKVDRVGDDRILFMIFGGVFFASVNDFPGWKGNCIVFCEECIPITRMRCSCDRLAMFDFESGYCQYLPSLPGYPEVFKPSPTWLSSDAASLF